MPYLQWNIIFLFALYLNENCAGSVSLLRNLRLNILLISMFMSSDIETNFYIEKLIWPHYYNCILWDAFTLINWFSELCNFMLFKIANS